MTAVAQRSRIEHETASETDMEPTTRHEDKSRSVSVRNLYKSYDTNVVLNDVSFDIRRGEFFSLLGPSGCGKTTLLRTIGGFEVPDNGAIYIDGRNMGAVPPHGRPTNMIFQHLALFPHLSTFENVAFGLRVRKHPKDDIASKVRSALMLVQLDGFEQRMPNQLSGGQRQRVAMARALVNEPSVLLLDEPLGALDLQLRLQMHEELRRLQRTLGNTFIFVTHDQGEAMAMSDRIAVMNKGKICQIGTPQDIYEKPQSRFVAQFVGHTNLFTGEVREVEADRAIVDCRGVLLHAVASRPLEPGQTVTIALRYERLVQGAGECTLRAPIIERIFLGGTVRIVTELGNGQRVTADLGAANWADLPREGSPVTLSFEAKDARVLLS